MDNIKNTLISFWNFLFKGEVLGDQLKVSLKFFAYLYFIKLSIIVFFISLIFLVFGIMPINEETKLLGNDKLKIFLNMVVLAPIIEEFIFRFHQNLKFRNVLTSLGFSVFLFFGDFFLIILIIYFSLLLIIQRMKFKISKIGIVYSSSLLFALGHVIQNQNWDFYLLNPQLIISFFPHFISALMLSFIFLNKGIKYSIFFHAFWNFFPFLMTLVKIT
jgi:uncharacterized protein